MTQFLKVRTQPRQFFRNVDTQREQIGFLRQAFGQFRARDMGEAARKGRLDAFAQLGGQLFAMFGQQLR
ncbi:hypothetical protein D3C77_724130 [compost metagenome]